MDDNGRPGSTLTDRDRELIESVVKSVVSNIYTRSDRYPDRPLKRVRFSVQVIVEYEENNHLTDRDRARLRDHAIYARIIQMVLETKYPHLVGVKVELKAEFISSDQIGD